VTISSAVQTTTVVSNTKMYNIVCLQRCKDYDAIKEAVASRCQAAGGIMGENCLFLNNRIGFLV